MPSMPLPLTHDQLHYLEHRMGVISVTNPYQRPLARGGNEYFEWIEASACDHFEERSRTEPVRFDDLYSEREQRMWAELQHFRAKSEHLATEIAAACKILQTDNLVESVRAVVGEKQELKTKLTAKATDVTG